MTDETLQSRREILVALTCAACSSLLPACGTKTESPPATGQTVTIKLSDETALTTIGGSIRKSYGTNNAGQPVIVVRTGQSEFKTMSTVCSHSSGSLQAPSNNRSVCDLHGSPFSTQSANFAQPLSGPATTAVKTFTTTFDATANSITIQF